MRVNTPLRPTCTDGRTFSPDVLKLSGFVAGVVDADGEGEERHGEGEGETETVGCLLWVVALGM